MRKTLAAGARGRASLRQCETESQRLFEAEIAGTLPVVVSIDTAQKGTGGSSRHAIQVWRTDGRDHYLVEAQSLACNYGNLRASLARLIRKFSPGTILIEDASSGSMLISELKEEGVANVHGITPRGSKADRLAARIGTIKKKRVHLLQGATWLGDWTAEILEFPAGADDQVDALTQFLAFMAGNPEVPQPPPPEKKLLSRIAAEIWNVPDACIERVIANVDNGDFSSVLMESLRLVGFSLHPETADEFLNQILESCLSSV